MYVHLLGFYILQKSGSCLFKSFSYTVNIDIFACIHFRGSMKMGNFACIKIRVFSTNDSLGYNNSNFHSVYIFAVI